MRRKLVSLVVAFALLLSTVPLSLSLKSVGESSDDLVVTEVGFPNAGKKVETGSYGLTEFRIYLSKPLNLPHDTILGEEVNDFIRINGKTVTEWRAEDENNVYLKYWETDQLIDVALPQSGALGQNPQTLDLELSIDPGLTAADGSEMTQGQTFLFIAKHWNGGDWPEVPYVEAGAEVPLMVTEVGYPNGNKKVETEPYGLTEMRIYLSKPLNLPNDNAAILGDEVNDLIRINGKTVTEWRAEGENNVELKYWENEQLIDVALWHTGALGQNPQTLDLELSIDPGLTAADGSEMTQGQTFLFIAKHWNGGDWPEVPYVEAGAEVPLMVTEVGYPNGNKKVETEPYGLTEMRIYLSKPLNLPNDNAAILGDEVNDLIRINGKTVTEWRAEGENNVELKYWENEQLIDVALWHTGALGQNPQTLDLELSIDPGLTAADGSQMPQGQAFQFVAKHWNGGDWPAVSYGTQQPQDSLKIADVGVASANVKVKEFEDIPGVALYYQIRFTKELNLPNGAITDNSINDLFEINGKTVTAWREQDIESVRLEYNAGQSMMTVFMNYNHGLGFNPPRDLLMRVAPGLTAADGSKMTEGQAFEFVAADENEGFWPEIPYETEPVEGDLEIQDVGVASANVKVKDFELFPNVALYYQIRFTKELDLSNGPITDNSINDLFEINGKTVTAWREQDIESVRLEYNAGQSMMTVFMNYNHGLGFNPPRDLLMRVAPGLTAADGSKMTEGQAFEFVAADGNEGFWPEIPYETEPEEGGLEIQDVGVASANVKVKEFELVPGVALYYQIRFTKELNLPNGNILDNSINDLFEINGKTVTEWREQDIESVRLEYNAGQNMITVFMNYNRGLGFNPPRDLLMHIAPGLTATDGDTMTEGVCFQFTAADGTEGMWPEVPYDTQPPEIDLDVVDVGVASANMKVKEFELIPGVALYYQIRFTKELNLPGGDILDDSINNLFRINGKTVTEWRKEDIESVRLEYNAGQSAITVFLNYNHGLGFNPPRDLLMHIAPGLTATDGDTMTEGVCFQFTAADGTEGMWPEVPYDTQPPEIDLDVVDVGVASANVKVQDFELIPGVALYYQIRFTKELNLPNGEIKDNSINDLFRINGKTVTAWREQDPESVRLEYNLGQSMITVFMNYNRGLAYNPPEDLLMHIAPGLTAKDGDVMEEGLCFQFVAADGNEGFWPEVPYDTEAPVEETEEKVYVNLNCQLVDADNNPLTDVMVRLDDMTKTYTDRNGLFFFGGLTAQEESYTLSFVKDGKTLGNATFKVEVSDIVADVSIFGSSITVPTDNNNAQVSFVSTGEGGYRIRKGYVAEVIDYDVEYEEPNGDEWVDENEDIPTTGQPANVVLPLVLSIVCAVGLVALYRRKTRA